MIGLSMNNAANIVDIVRGTTVDGPGFRTSVYFAGCRHECEGCHNPQSWNFNAGSPMSVEELMQIIGEEDFDVTLTGGDPLYNVDFVISLADKIHDAGHTVWVYTGFTWEQICENTILSKVLDHIDVIVDSPFVISLRDTDLLFRGSSNQRIIDVCKSLASASIVLWERS